MQLAKGHRKGQTICDGSPNLYLAVIADCKVASPISWEGEGGAPLPRN